MIEKINGRCFTNLDDYDTSIVNEFYRVPNIGERVYVKYKGESASLKVVQITHSIKDKQPFINIELHK